MTTLTKPLINISDYLNQDIVITSKKHAIENCGGLSKVSKMRMLNEFGKLIQVYSYNLPATECKVGSILAKDVPNSTCSGCYALGGLYELYGHNKPGSALYRRLDHVLHNPLWRYAMVYLIEHDTKPIKGVKYFRFHDAGDIQNDKHLEDIIWICEQLPGIKFWLPSREHSIIQKYIESGHEIPSNLNIRMSAYMNDARPPKFRISGFTTSTVIKNKKPDYKTWICPATIKNNPKNCGNCSSCWNKKIPNISYFYH